MKLRQALFASLIVGGISALAAFSIARADAGANPADPGPTDEEKPIDFEKIVIDDKDTKTPKLSDWQTATRVRMTRRGPRAEGCRAWRVRAWIKVHCSTRTTAISLLGGSFKGVSMWLREPPAGAPAPEAAEVVFPIRPGDRRVFEFFSFGETYGGSMVSPGLLLQEYWIEGAAAPTIVMY
ncbi:MAG: hypothetical protein IPM54_14600 [Polyangiaceae bacterium]|nr:hypothetical protein [Polyangiaceae bacterium]